MENTGEKIYNLRKEKNVSQEELSYALNVSRQTVSKWENNSMNPTIDKLKSICEFFNVDINYFFDKGEIATANITAEEIKHEAIEIKDKSSKFKNVKIMSIVVASVLLLLFILACGIGAYVTIAPSEGSDISVHIINYEGIICLIAGVVAVAIFSTMIILIIINRRKK